MSDESGYWAVHVRRAGKDRSENGNCYVLGPIGSARTAVGMAEDRYRQDMGLAPSVALHSFVAVRDESRDFADRFLALLEQEQAS